MILAAALLYLVKIVGGLALTHLLWDSRDPKHLAIKFFLGTGAGLGISSMVYFVCSWLGLAVFNYLWIELIIFVVLLTTVFIKEYKRKLPILLPSWRMPSPRTALWLALALFAIALCSANFWLHAAQNPHGYNDAWAIWNSAARFIYLTGNGWPGLISKNAWQHADYPLMLSLNVAEGWAIAGVNSTRIPILVAFLFVLSIIGLLFSALAISKDFEQAALATLLIAGTSQLPFLGSWQYADVPLAYFFLATAALIYLYTLIGETRLIVLAGLFAALSAWTKNEGLVFALICCALLVIWSLKAKKNVIKSFLWGALFPGVVIILFKTLTPPNDLFVDKAKSMLQLLDPARYQLIFSQMAAFILSFGGWPVSLAAILVLYALFVFERREQPGKLWLPALLCLGQFGAYCVIYLLTPHDLATHIMTSLDRLLFHLFPLALFVVFTALTSPRSIFLIKQPALSTESRSS